MRYIATIAAAFLWFLAFSFIEWELNPANWDAGTRSAMATLSIVSALCVYFAPGWRND